MVGLLVCLRGTLLARKGLAGYPITRKTPGSRVTGHLNHEQCYVI